MKPRPSVCHVITESAPLGGAQLSTLATMSALRRSEAFECSLVAGEEGPMTERARELGFPVTVISMRNAIEPAADLYACTKLARFFRASSIRLVHSHSTKAGLLCRISAHLARCKVIHTIHGTPFAARRSAPVRAVLWMSEWLATPLAHATFAVGEQVKQEYIRARIPGARNIEVVRSGIDFAPFDLASAQRDAMRAELGIGGHVTVVLAVGHLRPCKGYSTLLDAAARLRSHKDLLWLIAGEGPLMEELQRTRVTLGLEERVRLLGARDDVPRLLAAADLYVRPSLWEGVGRALTEAMAVGLPVIATDVNATRELVIPGETGLLVTPDDASALAQAVQRLRDDRAYSEKLGAAGQAHVRALWSEETMVKQHTEAYDRVLGSSPLPVAAG